MRQVRLSADDGLPLGVVRALFHRLPFPTEATEVKVCPGYAGEPCGLPTTNISGRCAEHGRELGKLRRDPYNVPEWRRRSKRLLAQHRARYGNWCPGYDRPGHLNPDLTLDHVVPLSHGGTHRGQVQVLCRSCNDRKSHVDSPRRRPQRNAATRFGRRR